MGKIECFPFTVVKGQRGDGKKVAGLLKFARTAAAKAEVLGGVAGMAEVKTPAEVEKQSLA